MSEYTPSMNEIRADFITLHTHNFDEYTVGRSLTSEQEFYGEDFDRAIAAHDEQVRAAERERCAQVALGPSHSGILHDGATARDIALAIRTVPAEQKESEQLMSEEESNDQFSSGEHKRVEMYGGGLAVCDTCINSLGFNIRWDMAPCREEAADAV